MKKIAAILLFIFTLTQAGPAVTSFFSDPAVVFVVDEEKGGEQNETEKKEKNDYPFVDSATYELSFKINTALHVAEKILTPPSLEKPTPPPNFC
jgi:hypothetical protein